MHFTALGPLTNIAMAISHAPSIQNKLKGVVIMGGNLYGHGNSPTLSEFNFYHDPEAAFIVLERLSPFVSCFNYEI